MTAPWAVTLEVAGNSWTVTDLDPATPGPTAPLTIRHALPDDQPWPSQPLPMAASFGLIAATAAELDDVVKGARVWISYTAPPNPDPVTFAGNVSDVEVEPARFRPAPDADAVDGVRVTVTAIGYLAQLMEEPITLTEDDFGTITFMDDRLVNLFDGWLPGEGTPWNYPELPVGFGYWSTDVNWHDPGALKALKVDGESLGPHLDRLLRVWLWDPDNSGQLYRFIVRPIVDPVTHQLGESRYPSDPTYISSWELVAVPNTVTIPPTGELVETPQGWGVVVAGTISASRVDRGIRYVQRKGANLTMVVVSYLLTTDMKIHTTSQSNGDRPTVRHTVESDLAITSATGTEGAAPDAVAAFYLPSGGADAWGVDTVTWLLRADEPGQIPPDLGELVVIGPVPASQNPNGRGWLTGLVRGWTLTLPDAVVELELATAQGRTVPDTTSAALSWDELPATITWDDLRTTDTWDDYQHLRGA